MRYTSAILFLVALASSGCSSLIARCGYYPDDTTTIEKVRQKFGEPTARGIHDRLPYEEFHTRLMIAEPLRGASLGLGFAFTFGLSEVIAFPYELCRTGAHRARPRHSLRVRFCRYSDALLRRGGMVGSPKFGVCTTRPAAPMQRQAHRRRHRPAADIQVPYGRYSTSRTMGRKAPITDYPGGGSSG